MAARLFVIGFVAVSQGIPPAFGVAAAIALAGAIGTSIGPRLVRATVLG